MRTVLLLAAFAFIAGSPLGRASDNQCDDDDVDVKVAGPIQAVDLQSVPPTIQVLGLTIDMSGVLASDPEDEADDDDGEEAETETEDGDDDSLCANDLVVGAYIRVKLASDAEPLVAAKAEFMEGYDVGEVWIEGPLQAVDPDAQTVTILGLVIDLSALDPEDPPLDLQTLFAGLFVEVELAGDAAPLQATEIEVNCDDNELEIELVETEDDGDDEDEGEDEDEQEDEYEVCIDEKVAVAVPNSKKKVVQILHFVTTTNTTNLSLAGLPPGKAKISVLRGGAQVGKKNAKISANKVKSVRIKVK